MADESSDESSPEGAWKALQRWVAEGNLRRRAQDPAISKPLNAFVLGCLSHGASLARGVRAGPEELAGQLDAFAAIDRLSGAISNLKGEIDRNLRVDLVGALKEMKNCVGDRDRRARGSRLVMVLRRLADRALDADNRDRPWYDLGTSMGDYRCALYATIPSSDPSSPTPVPDFAPVFGSVVALPEDALKRVPLLASLAALAKDMGGEGARSVLARFIDEHPDAWPYRIERVDELTAGSMMTTLVDRITEALRPKEGQRQKPVWNPVARALSIRLRPYDAEPTVIRRLRGQGNVIDKILDHFEDEEWPRMIDDPFSSTTSADPRRLSKLADSLNVGLKAIRFRAVNGNRQILWERLLDD